MTAKASKKLTKTALQKIDSQLTERKKITVLGQYEVYIDTYFKLSKIQNVAMDYLKIVTELQSRPDVTDRTIMRSVALISTLAVKEFSDAPIPDVSKLDELLKVSAQLLDTGILKEIWDAFPQSEIARFEEEIDKISIQFGKQLGEAALAASLQEQDRAATDQPRTKNKLEGASGDQARTKSKTEGAAGDQARTKSKTEGTSGDQARTKSKTEGTSGKPSRASSKLDTSSGKQAQAAGEQTKADKAAGKKDKAAGKANKAATT